MLEARISSFNSFLFCFLIFELVCVIFLFCIRSRREIKRNWMGILYLNFLCKLLYGSTLPLFLSEFPYTLKSKLRFIGFYLLVLYMYFITVIFNL